MIGFEDDENSNLLILGCGGHGRVVKEAARSMGIFNEIDFLDDNVESEIAIGRCSDYEKYKSKYKYAFVAFGNPAPRRMWIDTLKKEGFIISTIIHPSAYVSPSAKICSGTIIGARSVVNTNAVIESGCIIGIGAMIDHDTYISEYSYINAGAIVKSGCKVDSFTQVDAGMIYSK